ncbi:hypothetical protein NDU88_003021 [Pleurodeles waltl]|uniref:Uncharacterized protein n=1 Tax=Pleurodeles waltl TaxID=8319 RepID=A0AAV7UBJ5_PLEWA|nr:hypothetical protein NDU88_003021 [Pleurodeles waltl]
MHARPRRTVLYARELNQPGGAHKYLNTPRKMLVCEDGMRDAVGKATSNTTGISLCSDFLRGLPQLLQTHSISSQPWTDSLGHPLHPASLQPRAAGASVGMCGQKRCTRRGRRERCKRGVHAKVTFLLCSERDINAAASSGL